jgi:hypothetical protein
MINQGLKLSGKSKNNLAACIYIHSLRTSSTSCHRAYERALKEPDIPKGMESASASESGKDATTSALDSISRKFRHQRKPAAAESTIHDFRRICVISRLRTSTNYEYIIPLLLLRFV